MNAETAFHIAGDVKRTISQIEKTKKFYNEHIPMTVLVEMEEAKKRLFCGFTTLTDAIHNDWNVDEAQKQRYIDYLATL